MPTLHTQVTDIALVTAQQQQYPGDFKCVEESPVDGAMLSPYDMYYPSVDMRHIFCGQIVNREAQGFHSLNLTTDWTKCAVALECHFFPNQNAYCEDVYIRTRDNSFEFKSSGSSMWPLQLTPVQLVPLFQYLYSTCQSAPASVAMCFPRCYWLAFNNNYFDIVIVAKGHTILSAYPAQLGTCSNRQRNMKICGSQPCQGL